MPSPQDLIHVVSTTTGTGDMTVSAVIRNFSDSDAFGTGTTADVFDYFGWNDDVAGEWERGTGHMSAANTLVRDTIKASSNGGAAVNWSAGTKHFSNDVPAAKQVDTDSAQTLTNKTLTSPTLTTPDLGVAAATSIALTPASASTDKAVSVTQTGPTSGTQGSNLKFNLISINSDASSVTDTNYGLSIEYGFGGSNMQGQRVGLRGLAVLNSPSASANPLKIYAGLSGEGQIGSSDGGTDTSTGAAGSMLGIYGSSIAQNSATNLYEVVGLELNTSYRSGTSGRFHIGARIAKWFDSIVDGAEMDAGLQFINQSGASGWKHYGIVFDKSSVGAGTLFQSGASIIATKGSVACTNGIDFSSSSFSGAAFKSFGFFVNGSGAVRTADSIGFSGGVGAGTNVTQATSKSTAVTLNKCTGYINMNAAALAAGASVAFVVNNSAYSASTNDQVIARHIAGGTTGAYDVKVRNASSTSAFTLVVTNNTAGSLSESPLIGFIVIKGAVD